MFVQPSVSIEELVDACLVRNVICPVVIECRDMSVGGAFCGTAGESSSFRQGLFNRVVKSVEFVARDGTHHNIVDEGTLRDIANSYGTLGIVVAVELKLDRITKDGFVRLEYTRVRSAAEVCNELNRARREEENTRFIEAIIFEKECLVVRGILGIKAPGSRPVTFLSRNDPWYIDHLQSKLDTPEETMSSDVVPYKEYFFRWRHSGFGMAKHAFKYYMILCNRFTRWLLDPAIKTGVSLKALQTAGLARNYVIKDIAMPPEHVPRMVT